MWRTCRSQAVHLRASPPFRVSVGDRSSIQRSMSLRRNRHAPPTLNAGISSCAASRYSVRLPTFKYAASSSRVKISSGPVFISPPRTLFESVQQLPTLATICSYMRFLANFKGHSIALINVNGNPPFSPRPTAYTKCCRAKRRCVSNPYPHVVTERPQPLARPHVPWWKLVWARPADDFPEAAQTNVRNCPIIAAYRVPEPCRNAAVAPDDVVQQLEHCPSFT